MRDDVICGRCAAIVVRAKEVVDGMVYDARCNACQRQDEADLRRLGSVKAVLEERRRERALRPRAKRIALELACNDLQGSLDIGAVNECAETDGEPVVVKAWVEVELKLIIRQLEKQLGSAIEAERRPTRTTAAKKKKKKKR